MEDRHCQRCDRPVSSTSRRFRCGTCQRLTCVRCQTTTNRHSTCHDCRRQSEERRRQEREDRFRAEGRLTWARKEGLC